MTSSGEGIESGSNFFGLDKDLFQFQNIWYKIFSDKSSESEMGFESVTDSVVGIRPFHPYRGVADPFDLVVLAYRAWEAFGRAWHRLVVVPFRVEVAYRPFQV